MIPEIAIPRETFSVTRADDLWRLAAQPEYADQLLELVEGKVMAMSRPGGLHGMIASEACYWIVHHVRQHNLGYVTVESGYILATTPDGRDTVRGPDVGFVRLERAPDGLPLGYVPFAPDLAIEVISPNDLANEVETKIDDYLRAGTQLVWAMYAVTRTVIERRPDGIALYRGDDTLDGGEVLPGFTLPLRTLFKVAQSPAGA